MATSSEKLFNRCELLKDQVNLAFSDIDSSSADTKYLLKSSV
jgi:hypothetical protein